MATQHLDLNEQEQLANIKHFWNRYGKWLSAVLAVAALAYLGWTGWNYWQNNQAQKSAVLFDELSKAVAANDIDKTDRVFADMKNQFGATSYTAQAALLDARLNYSALKTDNAKAALQWLVNSKAEAAYKDLARLRLAGIHIEAKKYDEAIQLLSGNMSPAFVALAADRLGDAYVLQNKLEEAKAQYLKAYAGLNEGDDYRKMVEVKLARMGAAPETKVTP
ncbi:MAG: tetratricopeptide repeat protein [Cytophagales bacterium]|nr:tetratricopeptide repeat protein [Cytophagales bacterium]